MKKIIFAVIFITSFFSFEVFSSEISPEEYMDQIHKQNMKGWKGITFICKYDDSVEIAKELCERSKLDFNLLTTKFDIKSSIAGDNQFFIAYLNRSNEEYIFFEIDISTTKPKNQYELRSFYIETVLYENYSKAISIDEKKELPRNGDLHLYSLDVIASGNDLEILKPLGDAVETNIKKILLHFMKYGDSWKVE